MELAALGVPCRLSSDPIAPRRWITTTQSRTTSSIEVAAIDHYVATLDSVKCFNSMI
jgi:hypothetical protein